MTLPHRKWRYALIFPLLITGFLAATQPQGKYFQLSKNLDIFAAILKELETCYVEDIDPDAVVRTGIDAMLQSLDPYTNFIDEEGLEHFQTFTTGEYGGIGAILGVRKDRTTVIMLYEDCPAYKGGLHVGDTIVQIDGEDVTQQTVSYISSLLKGIPSTQVQVTIERPGQPSPQQVTLTRQKVTLKNVPYFGKVKDDIGYIRLADFTSQAADEVHDALASLKEAGMQKLILDLRSNPGGLLEEAINVVNLFVDQDLIVVETKSKIPALAQTYTTTQPAYDTTTPIVVLIDQQSASASEIVAGVIQDYDRGVLIGKSTFGKGLVQITRPLPYNTGLKLTIAKYYIPSGRSIQKIDYGRQSRKAAASAEDVPNATFATRGGRRVYDGSGITPDIEEEKLTLAPITASLRAQGHIFDYASLFRVQNEHIAPAKEFTLSDAQYAHFVTWLRDKDYPYAIEHSIDKLLEQAPSGDIRKQIDLLKAQLQRSKRQDLRQYKSEIKLVLQESIVSRYYFLAGAIEAMIPHDQNIQRACALLQDLPQYHRLLQATE